MDSTKKWILRIMLPIVIVIAIAGIWVAKNTEKDSATGNSGTEMKDELANEEQTKAGKEIIVEEEPQEKAFQFETTEVLDLEELKAYGLPIIIDFGSEGCAPCRKMKPDLIAVYEKYKGKAIIKYLDVWADTSLSEGYPVSVIPTQMFIDSKGNPYVPSDELGIDMVMYSYSENNEHALTMHEGILTEEQMIEILLEMGLEE